MRSSLKLAGLALASMLLVGMALAGSAAAGPLWATCQEVVSGLTRYKDSNCEEAEPSTGKWSEASLAGTEKSIATGSLTLIDSKLGIEVSCWGEAYGLVGESNVGRIEKVENISCSSLKGCEKTSTPTAKAVNLPWKTELTETEGRLGASLKSEVSGKAAGWAVKCKVAKLEDTDECTTNNGLVTLVGPAYTKGFFSGTNRWLVLNEFLNASVHKANCSLGGAEAGEVKEHLAVLAYRFNGSTNEDRNLLLRAN